jgi:D-sedoheptulose 7-phosphate isomerase
MNNLDKIYKKSIDFPAYASDYFKYLNEITKSIDLNVLNTIVVELIGVQERGGIVYFIGNGGSASIASHFANDFLAGLRSRVNFKAISLCDNQSLITAIANDYGFEYIFSHQITNIVNSGDLVMGLSVSGNSKNIIMGLNEAKRRGAKTISISSFGGGKVKEIADTALLIPALHGEYGPAEDVFMILDHLISSYLYRYYE